MIRTEAQPGETRRYRFGAFELAASGELRKDGQPLRVPAQAARLLLLLVSRAGELVTREEIIRHLWPDTVIDYDQGLHNAVRHLREALADDPKSPRFIETVPRMGYRFIAPMEIVSPSDAAGGSPGRRPWPFRLAWPVAAMLMIAGGFGWLLRDAEAPAASRIPLAGLPTVAVLPFETDGAEEPLHLAVGIGDGLIRELGRGAMPQLRVIGRTSVRHLAERSFSLSEIAARVGATHLVTGTVRRQGERLRVGVELVKAADSTTLWSAGYDLSVGDVFRVEREIAGRIAAELSVRLGSAATFEPASLHPKAMEDYLAGRFLLDTGTAEGMATARQRFQAAVTRQPDFAAAHTALGEASFQLALLTASREEVERVRQAAGRALALDPGNAEALSLRGRMALKADWNWDAASRFSRRALNLSAGHWQPHLDHAFYLASLARHEEAIAEAETALRLDPYSSVVRGDFAFLYLLAERYTEALAAADRMAEVNPEQESWASEYRLEALFGLRREAEARDLALSLLASKGLAAPDLEGLRNARGLDAVLHAYLLLERRRLTAAPGAQDLVGLAMIDARLGDEDAALALLETAIDRRDWYIPFLAVDPRFASLRDDPRFRDLLRSAGVPAAVLERVAANQPP